MQADDILTGKIKADMTPMIDVVFLLLIFFMVAGQLAPRPEGDAEAPGSESAATDENPDQLMLVLDTDGKLLHEGQPVDAETVAALVKARRGERQREAANAEGGDAPGQEPVRLLADAGTPLKSLRANLELLREAGIEEVRLVTRSESAP
ncbi:MAG TPA: biopolymer transporter ExbD [Opitutae bacterium]|nr:biopolymer transporter ExbD [Opitutae bacterium]